MTSMDQSISAPVRKSVNVKAPAERAFAVFTAGFDSWWPRSHKLFEDGLQAAIIEGQVGGRCFQRAADGRECDWGRVLEWEPPHRLLIAWQLDGQWQFDADIAHASEVEVTFTPQPDGFTRVDLEHRYFERHGADGAQVQSGVDSPMGWGGLLEIYAAAAEGGLRAG